MGGDVPLYACLDPERVWNSPYGRGCSEISSLGPSSGKEFPVWAGMFRGQ